MPFAGTLHTFPTYQCLQKRVWHFLKFCLNLQLVTKIKKDLVCTHSFFTLSLKAQDLNKIKKNPAHTLLKTLLSRKRVRNFSKKKLNSVVVGARQNFQFFRQNAWFPGNNRGLL